MGRKKGVKNTTKGKSMSALEQKINELFGNMETEKEDSETSTKKSS